MWDCLGRDRSGAMEICSLIKVVVTIMYVSVKMHLIVHLKGIHFTVCNLQH